MPVKKEGAGSRCGKKPAKRTKVFPKAGKGRRASAGEKMRKHAEGYGKVIGAALEKATPDMDFMVLGASCLLAISEYPFGQAGYSVWLSLGADGGIKGKWFKEDCEETARIAFLTAIDGFVSPRLRDGAGVWEALRGHGLTPYECAVVLASFCFYFKKGEYRMEITDCLSLALPGAARLKEAMRSFSDEGPLVSGKMVAFVKGKTGEGDNVGTFVTLAKEFEEQMLSHLDPALVKR